MKLSRKWAQTYPKINGNKKVYKPKPKLFHLFFLKSPISISKPAKNIIYSKPVVPVTTMLLSRANTLKPCGPITAPAIIKPIKCGTLILFSNSGAAKMIINNIRNFSTGSSIGKLVFKLSNNMIFLLVSNFG